MSIEQIDPLVHQVVMSVFQDFSDNSAKVFLVGSRAKQTHQKQSDYDYILLLDQSTELKVLKDVSRAVNQPLRGHRVSVKVFDTIALTNLYHQDFFRFWEYQDSFIKSACADTPAIFKALSPPCSQRLFRCFVYSIVVQTCWSLANMLSNPKTTTYILEKLARRFKLNHQFLEEIGGVHYTLNDLIEAIERESLYQDLIRSYEEKYRNRFFTQYFHLFYHEHINKSDWYQEAFKQLPNQLRQSLEKVNLQKLLL